MSRPSTIFTFLGMSVEIGPLGSASSISKIAPLPVHLSSSLLQSMITTSTRTTPSLFIRIMWSTMAPFAIISPPCPELRVRGCCSRLSLCIEESLRMDIRMVTEPIDRRIWNMWECSRMENPLENV